MVRGIHHVIEIAERRFGRLERTGELLNFGIVMRILQLRVKPRVWALSVSRLLRACRSKTSNREYAFSTARNRFRGSAGSRNDATPSNEVETSAQAEITMGSKSSWIVAESWTPSAAMPARSVSVSSIPESCRKLEKRPLSIKAIAATGSPMACLTRFAVSRCSRTVVSVLCSVASCQPIALVPTRT
jgi:hypothetical protein